MTGNSKETTGIQVTDRHAILVLITEPRGNLSRLGLEDDYSVWFARGLGIPENRIRSVNVVDQDLPATIEESGIIIGGSSYSAYEDLPWIRRLKEFIRQVAQQDIPTLGICFGHQTIAEALGGKVEKGSKGREFGSTYINLTQKGAQDPLFEGLPQTLQLATSHADTVTKLPPREDLIIMANNDTYPNQSLAIGKNIRTLQPHPEITREVLTVLAHARETTLINEGFVQGPNGFGEFVAQLRETDVESHGRIILGNFNRNFVGPYHLGVNQ